MEYVISAVWIGLELLFSILFNGSFLSKKSITKQRINAIVVIWLFVCVYANMPINPFVKLFLLVAIYTTISLTLYQGTYVVHICLAIIGYIFPAAIDAITINGMCFLLGISYNTFVWRKMSYITLVTAEKTLVVFMAWLLKCLRKKGSLGKQSNKWILLSVFFPLISAVMLAFLFYSSPRDGDVSLGIVIFAGILIIANVAIIYVINSIEKATEQEQDLRLLRQQISIQAENYNALKKNYSVQRKSTHEFKRHIQTLNDLLEKDEIDAVREYVKQLQRNRTLKIFNISANHPIIDVILNQKYQVAQEMGINMQVHVNDLSSLSINSDELVVLLSNLLDNAIEACQRNISHPEIFCSIILEDDLYISIRNTTEPVEIVNGTIATTKSNPTEHGFGLPAVKYILEQLHAEYTFDYNDGWFQFAAELQL